MADPIPFPRSAGSRAETVLLDAARRQIRARQLSLRTEEAYLSWARRYLRFHGGRDPRALGSEGIAAFLTHLAVRRKVAPATQNQAASALLFLYREVLGVTVDPPRGVVRPRAPRRLPVVLTPDEVRTILGHMRGVHRLAAVLLYGSGLRLLECLRLRVKDVDFGRGEIAVRAGKGDRDRVTMLPAVARTALGRHVRHQRERWERDLEAGAGWAPLPRALAVKHPNAGREWAWQWVFPGTRIHADRTTGRRFRRHLHESAVQRAVKGDTRRCWGVGESRCNVGGVQD